MTNLDYWQKFVGEESPEDFLRNHGTADPELGVTRFLEDRNHLYGVVNQGQWRDTFETPEQYQRLTVQVYLLSYLEETREEWAPALEAKPPSIPRRYREKFDQDKYPPPPQEPVETGEISDSDAHEAAPSEDAAAHAPASAEEAPVVADPETTDQSTDTAGAEAIADGPTPDAAPVHGALSGDAGELPTDEVSVDRQE